VPDALDAIDETAFTSYDERRMIGASRRIERTAWEGGEGELHTGLQTLAKAKSQWRLYTKLGLELDTHLYGAPDWDVRPRTSHSTRTTIPR
jgi:DICT domain-containing protein